MGVIRKINERELVGGELDRDVYPVTSTSAVFDRNNKSLDLILLDIGLGGDIPLASRNVIVFRSSTTIPTPPLGGSWDIITNEITLPYGWSTDDLLDPPIWMSTGEFLAIAPDNPTWSTPILISGEDGKDGADGVNIEFIFKLTENDLVKPSDPLNSPLTEFIPEGWTDSPSGISDELLAEWMCMRKLNPDGSWDNWSSPALWSKWGVNGKDGDGVEYIYLVNQGEILKNPTPDNINSDEYQETGKFEGVEYVPTHLGWSDNPEGVTPKKTHEWVCVRKRKDGKWGRFSNPTLWAKWGEQGNGGISSRTMYAKTEGSDVIPPVVRDNINPGSDWNLSFPTYKGTEAVWSILAYITYDEKLAEIEDNEGMKVFGWQGPWVCTGANGKDGNPVNYYSYVYRKSEKKPSKPIYNDPRNPGNGWVDFPDSEGQWWLCIGLVNGFTNLIQGEWGEVMPLNGKDGIAKDGKFTEFRFAKSSTGEAPALDITLRYPIGWEINPPKTVSGDAMYMTSANINPEGDLLASYWLDPIRISGEQGPKGDDGPLGPLGPAGSLGVSGIPGVDIEVRYCLGTLNGYIGTSNPQGEEPLRWSRSVPDTSDSYPYIWCILGRKKYSGLVEYVIEWENPFKLSGTNGLPGKDGEQGKRGQLVYPEGIYDEEKKYKTDDDLAPYVFFDNNFYVLNTKMVWIGTEQKLTPDRSTAWVKFNSFEAVYAKVGIIPNGLIGSAVFNGNYMFSQQGIDKKGNYSNEYKSFRKKNLTEYNEDPYDPTNLFRPNMCIDFSTGKVWTSRGKVIFESDGSGQLADGNIKWNTTGNIECKGTIKADKGYIGDLNIEEGKSLSYTDGSRKMNLDSAGLYFSNSSNGSSCRLDSNGLFVNNGYGINLGEGGEILGLKVSVATSPSSWGGGGPFFGSTGNAGFLINSSGSLHTYNILGISPIGGSYPSFPKSAGRILFVKNVRGGIKLNGRLRRWDNEMNEDGFTFSDTKPRIFVFDGYAWNEFRCP